MVRIVLLALMLTLAAVVRLAALPLKVVWLDHRTGRVVFLLPVHHTRIEAVLVPVEAEIRLRLNGFYEGEIEAGQVDTVKPNVLRVTIPGEKPARFRMRRISFLGE